MRYSIIALAIAFTSPAFAQQAEDTIVVNLPVVSSFDLETTGPVGPVPQPVEEVAPTDGVAINSDFTFDLG